MHAFRGAVVSAFLLACVGAASAPEVFRANGKEVLGCVCQGDKDTKHGRCGYHSAWGSIEEKPWCRTQDKCGTSSMWGSWVWCDDRGVEKRRATDGKFYNRKEFEKYYGGAELARRWDNAKPYIEKRMAKNGKAYTVFGFRDYYLGSYGEQGWVEKWSEARAEGSYGEQGWGEKWSDARAETRRADDGKLYTWEEFETYYSKNAWNKWTAAGRKEEM